MLLAGFGSKNVSGKSEKGGKKGNLKNPSSPSKNNKNNKNVKKSFSVNDNESAPLKRKASQELMVKDIEKLSEKTEVPSYIYGVKDCEEKLLIHIINHSKVKTIKPFMIGSVDNTICNNIDRYIKESKEGINPTDLVDLSDGDRLKTLAR